MNTLLTFLVCLLNYFTNGIAILIVLLAIFYIVNELLDLIFNGWGM